MGTSQSTNKNKRSVSESSVAAPTIPSPAAASASRYDDEDDEEDDEEGLPELVLDESDDEDEAYQQSAKKRAVSAAGGSTSAHLFPPVTSTPKTTEDIPDDLPELVEYAIDAVASNDKYEVTAAAVAPAAVKCEMTAATAAAAEQPPVVGNAVYLLTYLGFVAWLMNETGDKTSYCKTACTRISDFLTFIGRFY
jgi:hypothetical protein